MILTVRGAVTASSIQAGGILMHQRVLEKESSVADMHIGVDELMHVREHPSEKGNLVLSNDSRAPRELQRLSLVQSNCIVEMSCVSNVSQSSWICTS